MTLTPALSQWERVRGARERVRGTRPTASRLTRAAPTLIVRVPRTTNRGDAIGERG